MELGKEKLALKYGEAKKQQGAKQNFGELSGFPGRRGPGGPGGPGGALALGGAKHACAAKWRPGGRVPWQVPSHGPCSSRIAAAY